MSDVEQWEHDEQRAMENEIISLREQVEKWKSLHESLTKLNEAQERRHEKQVEKLTKERDDLRSRRCEVCGYLEHEREHTGCLREQLAALAEQNEKQRKALLSANDFIFTLQQDLHSERCTDWYPEGAHNAAESMSESMRLIGNSCADFTDVVEALTIPDLASPVLNRILAEGMRMAAEILIDPMDRAAAQKICAQADELEKQNG